MQVIEIQNPELTDLESARGHLARAFPCEGEYVVKGPSSVTLFTVNGFVPFHETLSTWRQLFPVSGEYVVGLSDQLLKAEPAVAREFVDEVAARPISGRFTEWFMEQLVAESEKQFGSARDVIAAIMERFITQHGGSLSNPAVVARFEELLYELRGGIHFMLGTPVPGPMESRLREIGWSDRDIVDWPALAYRCGLIYEDLTAPGARFDWPRVMSHAQSYPLSDAEHYAIAYARQRAGEYLTPVLMREPTALWLEAKATEQTLLRQMTRQAIRQRTHPLALARELRTRMDQVGIVRDFERVARTEMAEARDNGVWSALARSEGYGPGRLMYRGVGKDPCRACLRLYKDELGMPRLYTVAQVEEEDAKGLNHGPWQDYHARIGPTHPNCRCTPFAFWRPAMTGFFKEQAEKIWLPLIERLGVFAEAE